MHYSDNEKLLRPIPSVRFVRAPYGMFGQICFILRGLCAIVAVAALAFACISGHAQTNLAAITGTVTDSTGAVIPNCQVEVKNLATSAIRSVLTNAQGNYLVPSLPAGSYEIDVTAPGLQKTRSTVDLALTGATANFQLNMASTSSQITVEASSTQNQLQSESHDVSQVVSSTQLVTLPNSGRNLINTATLGPASQPGGDTVNNGGDVGFFNQTSNAAYIAGLDNYHTLFLQDGVENVNLLDQTANILASVEAVQEVETTLSNAPARFAHPAVINVITKGGTNQFHGTAYDFLRNDVFNARNWFSNSVPVQRYNLFGANLGGPIVKNKVFGFFDYSGLRNGSSGTFTGRVPTLAERSGDFSGQATIYDPATYNPATGTSSPFPNNVIPSARFNPFANLWLANYPSPNTPLNANNVNYIKNIPNTNTYDEYLGRVDWNISAKHQLLGSIVRNNGLIGGNSITPGLFGIEFSSKGVNATVAETATLSSSVVNVAKIGYNRSIVNRTQQGAGAKDYATFYGLVGLNAAAIQRAPPFIGINGIGGLGDPYSPQGAIQNRFQYADEVNWRLGNHNIYFGGEFVRTQFYGYWVVNNNGQYNFAGNATAKYTAGAVTKIGNGLADFLLGYPNNAIAALGVSADPFRSSAVDGYIQDDWKIKPSLTLNIGLRYDFAQAPYDIKGHAAVISADLSRYIKGPTDSNFGDVGPRFGFAWSFDKNSVLRGGYGIYYAGNQWENLQFQLLYPPNVEQRSYLFSVTNQQPIQTAVSTSGPGAGLASPFAMPKVFKDPSVQEWNLNIERSLGANTRFTLGYLGNVSRHVESRADANQPYALSPGNKSGILDVRPNPNLSFVYVEEGKSIANYNALVTALDRRFANGLQFLASYTWSKAMDLLDGDNGVFSNQYKPHLTYAPAGWDRTNNFVFSGVYALPIGAGGRFASSNNWFNRLVIGGWQLSGVYRLATGEPIAITAVNNSDGSPYVTIFANKICNPNDFQRTRFHRFNASCFAQPANGQYGIGGRDSVRNPRLNIADASLSKAFKITEHHQLEFRAEAFNVFNHPNFGATGGLVGTPGIGQVTYSSSQRVGQFALKYSF